MEVSASQYQRQHMEEIGKTYLSGSSITDKDKLEGGDRGCSFSHVVCCLLYSDVDGEVNRDEKESRLWWN
jgi:hypothetical protein